MKKKKIGLNRKLVFNKEVISSLSSTLMTGVVGGATYGATYCDCPTRDPLKCPAPSTGDDHYQTQTCTVTVDPYKCPATGGGEGYITQFGGCVDSVDVCYAP